MKLSSQADLGLALEDAFAVATDAGFLERQLLRRGVDIVRTEGAGAAELGSAWNMRADWNGRDFPCQLEVQEWLPPESALLAARSNGLRGDLRAEFTALSRNDTRIRVSLVLRGSSFRDRMFLNSVALAKNRLARQFSDALRAFAAGIEDRAARAT